MKKLAVLTAGVLISALTMAQNDAVIDRLFSKYAHKQGFVTVNINGSLFGMLAALDEEDEDLQKMSKSFSSVKILAVEDERMNEGLNFFDEIIDELDLNGYKEFMTVTSHEANVKMLIKGTAEEISEFLMIVGGEDNALIHIAGGMRVEDIASMARNGSFSNIEALEHLEHLEERK